jgi:hypothetical protein
MNKHDSKIWKHVVGPIRGAVGETDFDKKIVKVDKAKQRKKVEYAGFSKKENTLINTERHELFHVKHPKMHEKTIRKITKKWAKRAGAKSKRKIYRLFQKKQ